MSTLEATTNMLNNLNEDQLLSVQWFILNIQDSNRLFQPLTKEELIEKLDRSRAQYNDGKYMDALEFSNQLREKYGI